MLFGIDLDGVVIDHTREFLRASRKFGFSLEPWQTNSNVFRGIVPAKAARSIKHLVYNVLRVSSKRMPGSLKALKALRTRVVIVSVQKNIRAEKLLWPWLKRHGILKVIPKDRIHIVRSRSAKIAAIRRLKPRYFLDDGLDVLEGLPKGTTPVLFDRHRTSRRFPLQKGIYPVKNWKEVLDLFR